MPTLGVKLAIADEVANSPEALKVLLLDTVKELTGIDNWKYDADDDICGICLGSSTSYARLLDDRPYVRFHSILMRNVLGTPTLLARLNELNLQNGHMHLMFKSGSVFAVSDLLIAPFIASHIAYALSNFCQIVDNFCNILQMEFGDNDFSHDEQRNLIKH